MFKSLLRDRLLLVLVGVVILIRVLSLSPKLVEKFYTYGFYPYWSRFLRLLTGWIPFSLGDLLYILAGAWLLWKAIKFTRLLIRRQLKTYLSRVILRKYLRLLAWIYIIFNLSWGLNYDRAGIPDQFALTIRGENTADLEQLVRLLQLRLNQVAPLVDSNARDRLVEDRSLVHEKAYGAYQAVYPQYPFLRLEHLSMKSSMFSAIGHYMGFTGYFNPFTGESQLNIAVPVYVQPFVACHEMGHQLGYARENEANFIGFLAGRVARDADTRYSTYADMYAYAMSQLARDSLTLAKQISQADPVLYRSDRLRYKQYLLHSRNSIEPVISNMYDGYLRLNNQPKGKATYDEVVQWLIAFMKKNGPEAI